MILELNYPKTGHAELSNCIIFIATPTPDVRDAGSRCQVCAPNHQYYNVSYFWKAE